MLKLYWFYNSFLLGGHFDIRYVWDAIWVSTWLHFPPQNRPKSRLGGVLGRLKAVLEASWAVLERLGGVLECLERVSGHLEAENEPS